MTADELLRLYPRETPCWLRRRLKPSQLGCAVQIACNVKSVSAWESPRRAIGPPDREQRGALLAPHLATPEGAAFAGSLGRGD